MRNWPDDGQSDARDLRIPTAARLYTEGVRALARRELTTQQLREKLLATGGRESDVDDVLAQLKAQGALDDRRAARVYANIAFKRRKRARARIQSDLEQLGIAAAVAREAVEEVCGDDLERRRLEQAVIFGLRGTRPGNREHEARRLFMNLVRQGYEADDVKVALTRAGVEMPALDN